MGIFDSIDKIVGEGFSSVLGDFGLDLQRQDFASDEAAKARRETREMYQNRYKMTMDDLRNAGLNPILAADGLTGSTPSMMGSNMPSQSASITSSRRAAAEMKVSEQAARHYGMQSEQIEKDVESKSMNNWLQKKTIDLLKEDESALRVFLLSNAAKTVGIRPELMIPGGLLQNLINFGKEKLSGILDKFSKDKKKPKNLKEMEKELMESLEGDFNPKGFGMYHYQK